MQTGRPEEQPATITTASVHHDRPARAIAQRATRHLLELERALKDLTTSGDPEYAANTIWLAAARLDYHFTRPNRCVLEEWDLAA